ncbi:MAG: hypothetical protein ACTHN5_05530 [Phycisphaerae bacterium]
MKHALSVFLMVLAAGSLQTRTFASDTPATLPAPSSTQAARHDQAFIQSLIARLAAPDFSTREIAQKEAQDLTVADLPTLNSLLDSAACLEARIRLAGRLRELEDEQTLAPPGFALNLQNATVDEVAQALTDATGVTIDSWPPKRPARIFARMPGNAPARVILPNGPRFNFSSPRVSFWEAIRELSRQHPLCVDVTRANRNLTLCLQSHAGTSFVLRNCWTHVGGFALIPVRLSHGFPPRTPDSPEEIQFSCILLPDPRMHVIAISNVHFSDLVDEATHPLTQVHLFPRRNILIEGSWFVDAAFEHTGAISLLHSGKCNATFSVSLATSSLKVENADQKVGQQFTVGGNSVALDELKVEASETVLALSVRETGSSADGTHPNTADLNLPTVPIQCKLTDSTGRLLVQESFGRKSITRIRTAAKTPLTLELSTPDKIVPTTVTFPLKDLPLK